MRDRIATRRGVLEVVRKAGLYERLGRERHTDLELFERAEHPYLGQSLTRHRRQYKFGTGRLLAAICG